MTKDGAYEQKSHKSTFFSEKHQNLLNNNSFLILNPHSGKIDNILVTKCPTIPQHVPLVTNCLSEQDSIIF